MIPYATFYYFFIVAFLIIPVIIAGLKEKRLPRYQLFLTFFFILLVFASDLSQFISLIVYFIWQMALVKWYVYYRQNKNNNFVFYFSVILSILPLVMVKVLPIFDMANLIGFLGISYLTFKTVEIIIDIRDGTVTNMNTKDLAQFLLFFPTISSGPIDRYKRFMKDSESVLSKEQYRLFLYNGINKIFLGFLYKFIIADLINTHIMETQFISQHEFLPTLEYMYAYSLYLFFDFAGYSLFAIGVSYLLGIKTPDNFNMPFISRNIKDFWNRWHMTLSFWFRDYIYMRFVYLMTKKKWIKDRYMISYIGYGLLFLTMGFWHGLALHYIAYGLYHAVLIICFDLFERKNKKYKFWKKNKLTKVISIIITFHAVCFGFLIFSGRLF